MSAWRLVKTLRTQYRNLWAAWISPGSEGPRRIPEAPLLRLAFLGGSVGTVMAQQTIRLLQIVVLIALTVALIVAGSPEALWKRLTSGDPWRLLGM